jgi:hypothetical protein
MSSLEGAADQLLAAEDASLPDGWFDRFYFNLHDREGRLAFFCGAGIYPRAGVRDGWALAVVNGVQTNLRFSDPIGQLPVAGVGPLAFESPEPSVWRLRLGPNPSGLELDATWRGRLPTFNYRPLVFGDGHGGQTEFDHLVQSGTWQGTLTVAGRTHDITDWWGQRDRSRGVRSVHARQGLHLWVQPQFDDLHVSIMYDADRDGRTTLCDGVVMHADGRREPVVDILHDLDVADDLEVAGGLLRVVTEAATYDLEATMDPLGGGYLAGGGYDGRHGRWVGTGHVATERWDCATVSLREIGTPLTDRVARFACGSRTGTGVFETALSRSSSYRYAPTLSASQVVTR